MSPTAEFGAVAKPTASTVSFAAAINAADLQAATHCFTRDACLITPDATAIRGRAEIRPILAQLIAMESKIEVKASSMLVAGEVALGSERWRICSAGMKGMVFERNSDPTLVLRYLEDVWKLAIATPWGWGRHQRA